MTFGLVTQQARKAQTTAPTPQSESTINTTSAAALAGPTFAPGQVTVRHLDLTDRGFPVTATPVQPPAHTAPTNTHQEA